MRSRNTKSFWAASVADFRKTPRQLIIGELSRRINRDFAGDERQQTRAWERQAEILCLSLAAMGRSANHWGVLLEMPLLRLGRRLDVVLLIGGTVVVIEFKVGATGYWVEDRLQAVDYALCLRDFHSGCVGRTIVPILCAERAATTQQPANLEISDSVAASLITNSATLADALQLVQRVQGDAQDQLHWRDFDKATYSPTPTIIEAAKAIYAGHSVSEIGRADASGQAIEAAAHRLHKIAQDAKTQGRRKICFVTGTPGSGKTLLGLNLVFSDTEFRSDGEPAALLSGNRPLVHVLQEALAEDAANKDGTKLEARRRAQAALQNLLGYLKEHSAEGSGPPPEHVVVYDEAQRAWDEETGRKLLGRPRSEPGLFLEIMARLPWSALICLVGPGQEINRGEGGLALWGAALHQTTTEGTEWEVHASPIALRGNSGLVGEGLLDTLETIPFPVKEEPLFHLSTGVRAHRNMLHGDWVDAVLRGQIGQAAAMASQMVEPPAMITRDLDTLKQWLRSKSHGARRAGLLASSGATRIIADGIPPSLRSDELAAVGHWFLKPRGDFRSSCALEVPLSEFVCQGLEIDYAGLCWGGDLVWLNDQWVPRSMRAPKWQSVRQAERRAFRMNSYRVLLTRARLGTGIFLPLGNNDDRTRLPSEVDPTYEMLVSCGCSPM